MNQHPVPATPQPERLGAMVETFKALSDLTRAQIVLMLADGEQSVGELTQRLETPQSTVSRHLAVLRAARLVQTRRSATKVYYRLVNNHVAALVQQAYSHSDHEVLGLPDHDPQPPQEPAVNRARLR